MNTVSKWYKFMFMKLQGLIDISSISVDQVLDQIE